MAKETPKPAEKPVTPKPAEKPLVIPQVPNGERTANDHERRLCLIERKLGMR